MDFWAQLQKLLLLGRKGRCGTGGKPLLSTAMSVIVERHKVGGDSGGAAVALVLLNNPPVNSLGAKVSKGPTTAHTHMRWCLFSSVADAGVWAPAKCPDNARHIPQPLFHLGVCPLSRMVWARAPHHCPSATSAPHHTHTLHSNNNTHRTPSALPSTAAHRTGCQAGRPGHRSGRGGRGHHGHGGRL